MTAPFECSSTQALGDRIAAAPPEELVAMLLEGARGFVGQAMTAIDQRDASAKSRLVNRVSAIIEQLALMLNYEDGGEVVENLSRIYEWWLRELLDASQHNSSDRLQRIAIQMGAMRESWQ